MMSPEIQKHWADKEKKYHTCELINIYNIQKNSSALQNKVIGCPSTPVDYTAGERIYSIGMGFAVMEIY